MTKRPVIAADNDHVTEDPLSHVRMRRTPEERAVAELADQLGAGELTLDEALAAIDELAIGGVRDLLTESETAELRETLEMLDFDVLVQQLRNLGP